MLGAGDIIVKKIHGHCPCGLVEETDITEMLKFMK